MQATTLESAQGNALSTALRAASEPNAIERSDACRVANQSYQDFRHSWERLNNLVYALCVAAVVFLIAAIVLAAAGSNTRSAGIVSFVGTVVTSIGARFVLKERNQARKDKLDAAKTVREFCDDAANRLDGKDLQAITS